MSKNLFKLQINFTKAYKGEDGNAYLEGIASGPEVDLTGERMSETALESMIDSLKRHLVEFRDAHKDEWNDDLGEIIELSLTDDNHLFYKAKLDLNLSGAKDLWYRMTELGKKYGVSIGGSIVKAGKEYVAELGREVFTYFNVDLHEISITRQAAYQYSFANAVLKSLPKKEELMTQSDQVNKTDNHEVESTASDQLPVTTSTNDTNLREEAAAATDAPSEAHEDTPTPKTGEEAPAANPEEAAAEADAETEHGQEAESTDDVDKSNDATTAAMGTTEGDEVTKSTVFGDWAEADLTADAVYSLSWKLENYIWYWMQAEDKSAEEKTTAIEDALADYQQLIMKVVNVLVQEGNMEEVQRAAEAFQARSPEAVNKSLSDKDAKPTEVTQTLKQATDQLETAQKSLKEEQTERQKLDTELTTIKARKTLAFNQGARKAIVVDGQTDVPNTPTKSPTLNRWFNS